MDLIEKLTEAGVSDTEAKAFIYREAGFSFQEIGERLGVSIATAYRLDLRARQRMVKVFEAERTFIRPDQQD